LGQPNGPEPPRFQDLSPRQARSGQKERFVREESLIDKRVIITSRALMLSSSQCAFAVCGFFLCELLISISEHGGPLFRQVYAGLRETILSGVLHHGDKLPSTRHLADQLGISRTVVLLAYYQLLAEGFVEGRPGSGTYIAAGLALQKESCPTTSPKLHLSHFGSSAAAAWSRVSSPEQRRFPLPYDFIYG
jgi:DNA-binding transcriptional regulator YhcF (GntR family)